MTFSDIYQAPGFLPWFEDLNNSPKEMTHYYAHTHTPCLGNCWLSVSRNKKEIHRAPQCNGLQQFGDSCTKGLRCNQPTSRQPLLQTPTRRGRPTSYGWETSGERSLWVARGPCGCTHWAVSIMPSMLWASWHLSNLSAWQSGGFMFPKQHIPLGRPGASSFPHSYRGRKTS